MNTRNILCCLWLVFSSSSVVGQASKITCELTNIYQLTIEKSPTLQRQHILNRSTEANKQLAASLFDYKLVSDISLNRSGFNLFEADTRQPIVGSKLNTNDITLSGGVQRMFRSGLTANASINYSRTADNYPLNSFNENVGAYISDNNTSTTISVTQPLLRGKGRDITTANESIANINLESQLYNAQFIASGELFDVVIGYWQYLGATRSLAIYESNESRVKQVLDITNELVKADKKPTSDLIQIQADLKDKERQTILARQQLYTAKQNLGRRMGLSNLDSDLIGLPLNNFPKREALQEFVSLSRLLEIANDNRADIKALRKSLEVVNIGMEVSENNLKPQLDAIAFINYGGSDIGNGVTRFFSPLIKQEGRNYRVGVGLSYVFPVNNNRAEAELLSTELQYTDAKIQIENQIRNIELNVDIAYNNLLNSIEALKKSEQSLTYYQEVFENEQLKFQTGLTTLLNLILFQERLTFAQLDYIQNQQQFAIAIGNLRYETGTLYSNEIITTQNNPIPLKVFYTLPQ